MTSFYRIWTICISLYIGLLFTACTPSFTSLKKNYEKSAFSAVDKQLYVHEKKKGLDTEVAYIRALLYSDSSYSGFSMDKAYTNVILADSLYFIETEDRVSALSKAGLHPKDPENLQRKIEMLAYAQVKEEHQLEAYQLFQKRFYKAIEVDSAYFFEQKLAYENAKRTHTHTSYKTFLDSYPKNPWEQEARAAYELLLFQNMTKDASIESYVRFLKEYPNTPYLKETQKSIFEMSTKGHTLKEYQAYVQRFSDHPYANLAMAWILSLTNYSSEFVKNYPQYSSRARLEKLLSLRSVALYPFIENEKFGWMDEKGKTILPAIFTSIGEDALCEAFWSNWMYVENSEHKKAMFDRCGSEIIPYQFDDIDSISTDLVRVKNQSKVGIYHREGIEILPPSFDDIKVISRSLLAYKVGKKWGLMSANGQILKEEQYDEIDVEEDGVYVRIIQQSKVGWASVENLLKEDFKLTLVGPKRMMHSRFKDHVIEQVDESFQWKNIYGKQVTTQSFESIEIVGNVFLTKSGLHYSIWDASLKELYSDIDTVRSYPNALWVLNKEGWIMLNENGERVLKQSWSFFEPYLDGFRLTKNDQKWVYIHHQLKEYSSYKDFRLFVNSQKKNYWVVRTAKGEGILDQEENWVIPAQYEYIEFLTDSILRFKKYGKYGLIDLSGKQLLAPTYEGIIHMGEGVFSLYKNKKFGVYVPTAAIKIEPEYIASLQLYAAYPYVFIAKKKQFGLINEKNKPLTDFTFEEIHYWTKEVMLVKVSDQESKLHDIYKNLPANDSFQHFSYLRNSSEEILLLTFRESGYGLLSNKKGRIMPEEYTDILNIGEIDRPFYFVEKFIRQADLYVILYINYLGEVVRQQSIGEKEYERIVCDE